MTTGRFGGLLCPPSPQSGDRIDGGEGVGAVAFHSLTHVNNRSPGIEARSWLKEERPLLTDIGEYIVGAYLQIQLDCDVVDYNVRPRGGGLAGPEEIDVVGLNHRKKVAYLCEVTTHIRGIFVQEQRPK